MKLVYFENERGNVITLVVQQIAVIQQNRVPTDTPTTVMLTNGQSFRVRNRFDECQKKLMATLEVAPQPPQAERAPMTPEQISNTYQKATGQTLRPCDKHVVETLTREIEAHHEIGVKP